RRERGERATGEVGAPGGSELCHAATRRSDTAAATAHPPHKRPPPMLPACHLLLPISRLLHWAPRGTASPPHTTARLP
ncbi:unnamed protein product, partial [Closterium sp. Naga37s-1]